ncbi:hypothetical protein RRX38_06945 [Pseudomonas sp. DTU_2021_1001937_2_SI_NGA_ILE_001]|uniref:hypothetical protein n=1 Tax=Pseudomonas sp. DTU_2021_1001937_2_SI_NGA_ILE_001 TaxID=3077589 RepID=UPI0028FC1EFD|nr:hypothetical protein [Pseudomonas sp. DTU_2021_1001937_2_SI_NGA_ILE_001]WNW10900.1 hypothetical protein RRX38_06945 [Pseudomonas sp. DTU_2021_1001937_2_SI_NGA_ILE_001]
MQISLIENGFDSLRKGYTHLTKHEDLEISGAPEIERFSALKDSILSIQHGMEILFKHILRERNELLLYSDISKLKGAYKSKNKNEISELYEADGVHTITFKESIDRLRDILNISMSDDARALFLKVETWRNKITHSAVIILEQDIAKTLLKVLFTLDHLLAPILGETYTRAQGRVDLERAYNLTKAAHGELENKVKAQAVEGLIAALQAAKINASVPDVVLITDPEKANIVLQHMEKQGGLRFSSDVVNGHCSGHTQIISISQDGHSVLYANDNECGYLFKFSGLVIYITALTNSASPLIYLFSEPIEPIGDDPLLDIGKNYKVQKGAVLDEDGEEIWSREFYEQSNAEVYSGESPELPAHKDAFRILSGGLSICLNVQKLQYIPGHKMFRHSASVSANSLVTLIKNQIDEAIEP